MTISQVQHPGVFNIASGSMTVTDPCYTPDTWCIHSLPAMNGQWKVEVGYMRDEDDLYWPRKRLAEAPAQREGLQEELSAAAECSSERFLADYKLRDLDRTCKAAQLRIDTYKGRVAYIRAWNVGALGQDNHPITAEALDVGDLLLVKDADIGVDSGQAGFIDSEHFKELTKDGTERKSPWHDWYHSICNATSDEEPGSVGAAVQDKCAFSHSGYGDGSYALFAKRVGDEAVEVLVNFMLEHNHD